MLRVELEPALADARAIERVDRAVALGERPGLFGIRLYDRQATPGNLLAEISPEGRLGVTYTLPVTIANHPWVLEVEAPRPGSLSVHSMLTPEFGLLVARQPQWAHRHGVGDRCFADGGKHRPLAHLQAAGGADVHVAYDDEGRRHSGCSV